MTVVAPSLALIVCAAPLAVRAPEIAQAAVDAGWDVHVIATPLGLPWIDAGRIREVTGAPPSMDFRQPDQPKRDRAVAALVCPMTFNTGNKLAAGIADNYAMAVLCEALGAGHPVVAVPMVNANLWSHPAWQRSLEWLTPQVRWVDLHDGATGRPRQLESDSGPELVTHFHPAWAISRLGPADQA